jgi:CHAT domain-containing protein
VVSVEEVAELLPDASSALLEYVVTEDKVYLFIITRDGRAAGQQGAKAQLSVHSINIKSKEVAEMAEGFRSRVASGDLTIKRPAQQLYDLFIKPAEPSLKGVTKLCIVPDGPLWHLPFQALYQSDKGYLLEQYTLFYAPSLSVLREMNRKSEGSARVQAQTTAQAKPESRSGNNRLPVLLAVGNPSLSGETMVKAKLLRSDEELSPLPDAEREVAAVARMYGSERSKVLVETQAREETVKAEAGRYSILHFATHAVLDDSNPMYSRIVLSRNVGTTDEDGLLEAWEILKLDLNADLAVLSACQTARGRVGAGEGMIGISWAMFVAGSPTVVVSQWKVDSARTADLMIEFHRNLLKAGTRSNASVAKAEALRQAALKLLHSPYNHPAYWAGFILVGSPR